MWIKTLEKRKTTKLKVFIYTFFIIHQNVRIFSKTPKESPSLQVEKSNVYA
ncbi:hypothetical protein CP10881SC42_0823 [Chlamydia avium]|uniref:Uncharacterized protein n=1 Tax=Chlamydia avium TaxID=1457141 RepID=A0ABN0MRI8_9CHLA|nr:hypothetical protein CP10743SC13_0742 [Chlamydia psittaci 10_743_SC13]EPP38074.1 hypothetical protein CP10881SC42_0823 [Chlamydia avium]